MSSSITYSQANTFTIVHARHIAAKVATDLKRLQRFYDKPSDKTITEYEIEIIEMLKADYLGTVTYGFRRNSNWVEPTLRYTSRYLVGMSSNDDDPGRIRPGANIDGTSFYSYMTYSVVWDQLSETEKKSFVEDKLPFSRCGAPEPAVDGYIYADRTYSSGGRSLNRSSVRSY